jgi:hypothetical protein
MLLSVYTYVKNGLFNDLHAVDMLKHHLPLADEIIVNEGFSSDGTYEAISHIDSKIRIVRTHWNKPNNDKGWYIPLKDAARRHCQGKWCLHLDADEFIPEWEFDDLRNYLSTADESLIPIRFINFYGNYKVFHAHPEKVNWPLRKMILHRNIPEIEFWGDGANVRIRGVPFDWGSSQCSIACHHFGTVRHAARLRQKWHIQGQMYTKKRSWLRLPAFMFNWRPHDWMDPQFLDDLRVYGGPYIKAVRDNPDEFVRDRFQLVAELMAREASLAANSR